MSSSAALPGGAPLLCAPTPAGHFLFGHLKPYRADMLGFLARSRAELGDIFRIRLASRSIHILAHPDMAEQLLIKEREHFGKLSELGEKREIGLSLVLGKGLVTNYGESWQRQRQMMQPMFHKVQIATMADAMTEAGSRLLRRWQQVFQPGQVVDISQEMMRVTIDVIGQTMFGADLLDKTDFVGERFPLLLRYAFSSLNNPLLLPSGWPTARNRAFNRSMKELDVLLYDLINKRLESGTPRGDLIDMLLAARDPDSKESMSIQQLRDEIATIFGAGHETTANGLTWTWYLLSQHPEVRAKLREELETVLGGRTPDYADLPQLVYTRAVFEESMRLFAPAPVLPRAVLKDTSVAGYSLRRGEVAMVVSDLLHRHPAFWREPDRFDPERFLPGETQLQHHRCAYLPFGGGPRVCIGNHFAMMEGQLLLAQIAQRYDLQLLPDHPVEREVAVTMRPRHGMLMTLIQR
ncbi:cytochrome P450 [Chitinimonas sp. BJB300]|uniref:cytochrome P450 n=1 Tax=Chitinimonas sp. BJB300 TaxID=1559339 RepID=UPI000C11F437|nr:cytochrome P450 [Chitinimonas sp. BJB300]PHV11815.1 cytochrome P450 [Chitinimonas sp. BJB300]TSJ87026.1 cytochrome P450 [Chitinimonas sp. BJB300]